MNGHYCWRLILHYNSNVSPKIKIQSNMVYNTWIMPGSINNSGLFYCWWEQTCFIIAPTHSEHWLSWTITCLIFPAPAWDNSHEKQIKKFRQERQWSRKIWVNIELGAGKWYFWISITVFQPATWDQTPHQDQSIVVDTFWCLESGMQGMVVRGASWRGNI